MNEEIEFLIEKGVLKKAAPGEEIPARSVIRRINSGKDQQGFFTGEDESGGYILVNVIDLADSSYLADAGIIRPDKTDSLYYYTGGFSQGPDSRAALDILQSWALYGKNPGMQKPMAEFMKTSFTPEYILYLKKTDSLNTLFIPMQQKLKIGRFREQVNPDALRKEKFREHLKTLKPGEHMTYIAMVPSTSTYDPKFYSIGTKPHEETHFVLKSESFNFKPTHGGHIKAEKNPGGVIFYVDAGSNYIGKGVKTKLETAESVVKALRREYSGYRFVPIEGRGAFGTEQSY
ncbi:MAG TPA: hypothetical protein PK358_03620 [Spirochaetota bacterium]|nr:hypothetical protein [Spirochaetota bacterium]HPJ33895.1 hypothetical protein [Spirochaetota bacterium]